LIQARGGLAGCKMTGHATLDTSSEGIMVAITFDTHEFIKDLQAKGNRPKASATR
jgi:hypothetical protein